MKTATAMAKAMATHPHASCDRARGSRRWLTLAFTTLLLISACGGDSGEPGAADTDGAGSVEAVDWRWELEAVGEVLRPDSDAASESSEALDTEALGEALEGSELVDGEDSSEIEAFDETIEEDLCGADCDTPECGADLGPCSDGFACEEGVCVEQPFCGNDQCNANFGEHCGTCAQDCGCGCGESCVDALCTYTACDERVCGDDGCGGSCGECAANRLCEDGVCVIEPFCGDGNCGNSFIDGIGEHCGNCEADCACACEESCVTGACVVTACDGRSCGDDGCGGSCGSCEAHHDCVEGACVYVPWCGDESCDGAVGESCATCAADCGCACGEACQEELCVFVACEGRVCGDDGCEGSCGTCAEHHACLEGLCVLQPWCGDGACDVADGESCASCELDCACACGEDCVSDSCLFTACDGLLCGDDGCGGSCGSCGEHELCVEGACVYDPWCGDGSCDAIKDENCTTCAVDCICACGEQCKNGACLFTSCDGRVCGDDGCDGSCGVCDPHNDCVDGACVYVPWCGDETCDIDEGENCATCEADCGCVCGEECQDTGTGVLPVRDCVYVACDGRVCGDDGCGASCGDCEDHHVCVDGACVYEPWCGDEVCDAPPADGALAPGAYAEDCDSCAADCGCGCGESCVAGSCAFTACDASYACGPDGCGGFCGLCGDGETCTHRRCTTYEETFYLTPTVPPSIEAVNEVVDSLGSGGAHLVVGVAMDVFYMERTLGAGEDYVFDPDGGLRDIFAIAEATDVPVFFHLNGGPWMTSAGSPALDQSIWAALQSDPKELMWDQQGQPLDNASMADGRFLLTLARDADFDDQATRHRRYKKRNLQAAVSEILAWADEHPGLFIAVGLDSEISQHGPSADAAVADSWSDYNPASIREFRAWLRQRWGDDIGAFKAAMGVSGAEAWQSFLSDGDGVGGVDIDPPRDPACIEAPGCSCDSGEGHPVVTACDAYWREWIRFRQVQVDAMVEDSTAWAREAGLPADRVYAHQIPQAGSEDPLWARLASPLFSAATHLGSCGITTYDEAAADEGLFASMASRCRDWGILEYNPVHAAAGQPASREEADLALERAYAARPHVVAPWAWSIGGDYAFYSTKGNPFEESLRAFVAAKAEIPWAPTPDTTPPGDFQGAGLLDLCVLDAPAHGGRVAGVTPLAGWALDNVDVDHVDLEISPYGTSFDGLDVSSRRADVDRARMSLATAAPVPGTLDAFLYSGQRAGFEASLDTSSLDDAPYVIRAQAFDDAGNETRFGDAFFYVDNTAFGNTVAPNKGVLELPDPEAPQGTTVSVGDLIPVSGWVLDDLFGMAVRVGVSLTLQRADGSEAPRRFAGWLPYGLQRLDVYAAGFGGVGCYSAGNCPAGFGGNIDSSAFQAGTYVLEVIAFDTDGNPWIRQATVHLVSGD